MDSDMLIAWPYPRAAQACDRCKFSKARCVDMHNKRQPSCKRCVKKGYSCVYQRHPYQSDGSVNNHNRISDIFDRSGPGGTNPIFTLGRSRDQDTSLGSTSSYQETEAVNKFHQEAFESLVHDRAPDRRLTSLANQRSPVSSPTSISHQVLNDKDLERYLQRYEAIFHNFPFLPLPRNWSVACMKHDHPFFLLGIVSAMTHPELNINSHLHAQFLRVLAERVVVGGEKSLDLLQGMLVQLAWFPMHLNPRRRHIFQVLRLAVGMIQDLILDADDIDPIASQVVSACNFVSSIISVAFHRPNSLPTHHYHDTLVPSTLTETPRKPVNVQLYFAIRAEWPKQILSEPAVDLVALAKSANEVNDELEYVASNLMPTAVWITAVSLSKLYAESQIAAITLFAPKAEASNSFTFIDTSDSECVLASLRHCLFAVKAFFTTLLSLPLTELRDLSFVQWAQLVQVFKIAPKLCFPIPNCLDWDAEQARDELRLDLVLDSLCYRMQELTSTDSQNQPHPDQPLMFKSVLKLLKNVYDERLEALNTETMLASFSKSSSCPMLNGSLKDTEFWDALNCATVDGLGQGLNIDLFDPNTFEDPVDNWLDFDTAS